MSMLTRAVRSVAKRIGLSLRNRFIEWLDPTTGLWRGGQYYPTDSGVNVSAESAMRVTTIYACVRIIAWTLASMPLITYRRLRPRGKERALDHELYALLHSAPNTEQTSFQFRALMWAHWALWGNCYAEIEFDPKSGRIVGLWPIPPWLVKPERTKATRALYYNITLPDGTPTEPLPGYAVFHIMGVSLDGLTGLSPVAIARQAIGLTIAAEEFGARFFGSGANVGGVAMHPKTLSEPAYKRLTESLEEKHQGLGKSHRVLLLEEGLKYEKIGIPPEDAQFLETRRFQVADLCRIWGVPSFMVNDTERTTSWGTGVEQMGIGLVVYTLRPLCVNWEQESQRKLFLGDPEYFAEHLVDGLLRGDIGSRYTAYAIGRQWGWLSADDVREKENDNPLPDGQGAVYLNPLNMISAKAYTKPIDAKKPAAPAALPEPEEDDGSRMRIIGGFRYVLADAAARILKREEADVMRQARKLAPDALEAWLPRFYAEHSAYVVRQLGPAVQAIGESADIPQSFDLGEHARQHAERSLAELREIVAAGGDLVGALQKRFTEWNTSRAGDVAAAVVQLAMEGRVT